MKDFGEISPLNIYLYNIVNIMGYWRSPILVPWIWENNSYEFICECGIVFPWTEGHSLVTAGWAIRVCCRTVKGPGKWPLFQFRSTESRNVFGSGCVRLASWVIEERLTHACLYANEDAAYYTTLGLMTLMRPRCVGLWHASMEDQFRTKDGKGLCYICQSQRSKSEIVDLTSGQTLSIMSYGLLVKLHNYSEAHSLSYFTDKEQ